MIAEVIIAGLAVWQIVEIWRHGSIFADLRARVELWEDGWLRGLLLCGFCLPPWVAWFLVTPPLLFEKALLSLDDLWRSPGLILHVWQWIVLGFAAARLANLGNDLAHSWCRTPGRDQEALFEDTDNEETKGP